MTCVKCNMPLSAGDEIVVELTGIYDDVFSIENMLAKGDISFRGHIIHEKCKQKSIVEMTIKY